ncbi:MAG: energy-coupled thiamine transporter ThiT [Clostridia bacterium]|nr:energy-coupled thiamine transporter ThiT [Clostridia bacterium]
MYLQSMLKKIGDISPATWIALAALLALGILLLVIGKRKNQWNTTAIAFAALAVALSFLLSHVRLYRMPQGGSITPASMLPIMLFAHVFGVAPGLLVGLAYGILEFLQTPVLLPIAPLHAICQIILDYLLAFGFLGLAGIGGKRVSLKIAAIPLGILLAATLRFLCSVASGVLFFAEYAGERSPLWYSVAYNGTYMLPETLICVAVGLVIGPGLCRIMRKSAGFR